MFSWLNLLQRPEPLDAGAWFARIADRLLNGAVLRVAGKQMRLTEIECYYHGPGHADPFSHCDPVQQTPGRWYFHRTGASYRGGSFKGLDLAFGLPGAFGGVLIRSLEIDNGNVISGPSLCVDYLLQQTGSAGVGALAERIGDRPAWEDNPLLLQEAEGLEQSPILRCARVGLSLKKAGADRPRFLLQPYRFVNQPRRVAKGKPQMVLALHQQGKTPSEIREITGCPLTAVTRYIAAFEAGRQEGEFTPYLGADLTPGGLCRLHGVWYSRFAQRPEP